MAFLRQHWQALLITVVTLGLATAAAGWIEAAIRGLGDEAEATTATHDRGDHPRAVRLTGSYLGVTLEETEDGLVVSEVLDGSPADDAGIATGDRLVSVAGTDVATIDEARAAVAAVEDDSYDVEVERNGEARTVQVQRAAEPSVRQVPRPRRGFDMPGLPFLDGPMLGISVEQTDEGIRVTSVVPGSGADEAGLEAGDIITEADGAHVATVEALREAVAAHEPGDTMELVLQEGTEQRAVAVEVTEGAPMASVPSFGFNAPDWFEDFPRFEGFDFDYSELERLTADQLRELRDGLAAAIEEGQARLGELGDELLRHLDELIERATARDGGGSRTGLDA